MKSKNLSAIVIIALAVLGSTAVAQQDRFTLRVPNGLAFSDFRGYDTWQDVAVSQTENGLKVIAGNDAMINAYRSGIPGNGKLFPDGSKITFSRRIPGGELRMSRFPTRLSSSRAASGLRPYSVLTACFGA
jgi:hypothetical protein